MRADARHNRRQILEAATAVFAEDGAHATLSRVAQRAGVGAGTLYRHFPTLRDLRAALVEFVGAEVEALCSIGQWLLVHPSPSPAWALRMWLRCVAFYATSIRGLAAVAAAAEPPRESLPRARPITMRTAMRPRH
jgi:AcrR family transcriptional regulator